MSDHVHHCPFLNRADVRCSDNFSLDRLDHAFSLCFGRYTTCPAYRELFVERSVRRSHSLRGHDVQEPIVQITIHAGAHRYAQRSTAHAHIPAASGV
jgi:hypothetical protein